jgi:DNA-binding NtrC family response regulator
VGIALFDTRIQVRRLGSLEPEVGPVSPAAFLPKMVDEIHPLEEIRKVYARHALSLYRGNVHVAARALEITDRTLLARLGKRPAERRPRIRKAR